MPTLDEILARNSHPEFQTAVRQAYDLGMVTASRANLPKTEERKTLIAHMLMEIEEELEYRGKKNPFIESLRVQFDQTGSLSPKQFDALRKNYEEI